MPTTDASAPDERLRRIAAFERQLRRTPVTRVICLVGRTRAFAAFYRRYGPKADPWLLRKTHGQGATRLGFPVLLLTTTGASSGLSRVMPLVYVRDSDGFVVVGTNFGQRQHPGWTANLIAHPEAAIEVGRERLSVTAELLDRATWERLWPRFLEIHPGYADYLTRCSPRTPRMFRLSPAGHS